MSATTPAAAAATAASLRQPYVIRDVLDETPIECANENCAAVATDDVEKGPIRFVGADEWAWTHRKTKGVRAEMRCMVCNTAFKLEYTAPQAQYRVKVKYGLDNYECPLCKQADRVITFDVQSGAYGALEWRVCGGCGRGWEAQVEALGA